MQITHDGVILSGAGQDPDAGTLIVARQRSQHTVIQVIGAGSGFGVKRDASSVQAITSERVAVGATSFELADASGFSVGDAILVTRTPNQAWIDLLGMAEFGWTPESYHIDHERQITAISGNTVTVDTPIVDGMEQVYGGGEVSLITEVEAVRQVGVQDLWIRSEFDGSNPEDEDHAWIGISFERTRDSWVQRVTGEHLAYATISFTRSARHNTAQEVAFVDPVSEVTGGRRYPFNISGSGNLIQRCYSSKGRHNFVAGARVAGPNVWLDCLAVKSTNDDGPHHRWSSGLLYDNTRSAVINVQNRKSSGSGHGWVGSQIMFWNGMADTMTVDAPRAGMNWAVGMDAELQESRFSPEESVGTVESTGLAVTPRSLYLAQLQDRLGAAVVASIATPEQLQGRIWRQLYAWRGRGLLADTTPIAEIPEACPGGVRSGNICCAAQCGECGGSGCSVRPGGSAQCCSSPIRDSGILCEDSGMAPCLISD